MKRSKFIATILGIGMVFSSSFVATASMSDLNDHWAKDAVNILVSEKVIDGFLDGTFRPDSPITREQTAKIADVYFGKLILDKGKSTTLSDIEGRWSAGNIKRLVSAEIINGYADGTFRPENEIKRSEVASIVYKALVNSGKYKDKGENSTLSDIEGHWAEEHIKALVEMGVVNGYSDGSFKPDNSISRGEVASMFSKIGIDYGERAIVEPPKSFDAEKSPAMITQLENGNSTMRGTISSGHSLKVQLPNGAVEEIAVGSDGNWSYQFKELLQVGQMIKLITTDSTGKVIEKDVLIPQEKSDFEYKEKNDVVEITKYLGSRKDVIIPHTINGNPVENIRGYGYAFSNKGLISVEIPETVKIIGWHSFSDNNLTYVRIPDSVTLIQDLAFRNNNISKLRLSDSLETIQDSAFQNNSLSTVVIPNSVKNIGESVFEYNNLSNLELGNSVERIGHGAFRDSQLTSVNIPESVREIGTNAFTKVSSTGNKISSLKLGNSVERIGMNAFAGNNISSLSLPNSLTAIQSGAFNNNSLTDVALPSSLSTLINSDGSTVNITHDSAGIDILKKALVFDNGVNLSW